MGREGDFYTVDEAAKVLKLTPGRIKQMLRSGELEGGRDEAGRWRIPAHAVHDRPRPPRVERDRPAEPPLEAREASERLTELEAQQKGPQIPTRTSAGPPGAYGEGGEHDSGERDRLVRELEEDRRELEEVRAERQRLQEELDEARRPCWRKMFGGRLYPRGGRRPQTWHGEARTFRLDMRFTGPAFF